MAETMVKVEDVLEHCRLLRRTMEYFCIESLSLAVVDLMKHSRTKKYGILKREPLNFYEARIWVQSLSATGGPRPSWCTGVWPNDLHAHNLGVTPAWKLDALEKLCRMSSDGSIRMNDDELRQLTNYKNIPILDDEMLQKYLDMELDEFEEACESSVVDAQLKLDMEEERRKGAEDGFKVVQSGIDTFVTTCITLAFVLLTFVYVSKESNFAWFTAVLGIVSGSRAALGWTRMVKSRRK